MTQETPAKVVSLLGVALTSMFFLFTVSVTNANFSQTEKSFPDVFNPGNVVAFLDNTASSYSNFIDANLIEPQKQSYAILEYNVNYIIDEAGPSILAFTGLSGLAEVDQSPAVPKVAGASTQGHEVISYESLGVGFSVDTLYGLLLR